MISMSLHQASSITGGTLIGKPIQFRGISTDSRNDCSGKLFVALSGDNLNGEDYCQQAIDNGAVGVLVAHSKDINVSQLICKNTLTALSILAKTWAKQCKTKIIAITGSNGKTTVKNMVHSILSLSNQCSSTVGNLNNEIGVPLTLCNINSGDSFAVIEMGAAKLGDISWLISLVNIHTAVITNVSPAHIGRFGSIENIVSEKGQIISTLGKNDFAILPIDDDHYALWQEKTIGKILSFGDHPQAEVTTESIKYIQLPVAGKHNKINATCAAAIAQSCNISVDDIKQGLESFVPESGRLENLGKIGGTTLINDSYNANPQSVKAAIDVLADYNTTTALVLGDMAELGDSSEQFHKEIGQYANEKGITHLFTLGKDSMNTSLEFLNESKHFDKLDSLKNHLIKNWNRFDTLLIKGSRSMHLEQLVDGLIHSENLK